MKPEWLHSLRLRCRGLVLRRQLERDLEDELRFHLEMKASRHRTEGFAPEQANETAHREFGNTALWKELTREMWTIASIEGLWNDMRYAARGLLRTPGVTAAAVLVLALGIGANTAIFSVVNATVLRPLPFDDPDELVVLIGNVLRQRVERRGNSYPDYLDWRAQASSFTGMAAVTGANVILTGGEEPQRIPAEGVSAGYFELLGVSAMEGRTFTDAEDKGPAGGSAAVISERLRTTLYGREGALGRAIQIDNRLHTIIGVMPAGFRGVTDSADLWVPFTHSGAPLDNRGTRGFRSIARLRTGVPREQAQTEMNGISKRLEIAYPATNEKRGVELAGLTEELTGPLRTPLLVLLGAVTIVLLIACANVANLLLARSEARATELAVRSALGASRACIVRLFLAEGLTLALAGTAAGLILAWWTARLLVTSSPVSLPSFVTPSVDWRVGLFTAALAIAVATMAGLGPALQAGQQDPHRRLVENAARTGSGRFRQRFRGALVISQVALATALVISAGLLMRSFQHIAAIDPGFDAANVLTMTTTLPASQSAIVSAQQMIERISATPGVTAAAFGSDLPLSGDASAVFYTAEGQPVDDATTLPRAYIHRISPQFFSVLRTPVVAGRGFTEAEMNPDSRVVVVSDRVASRFWPGQDATGRRIKFGRATDDAPWMTVVGVVREMKYRGLPENPTADPDIFLPFTPRQRQASLLVRTSLDAASVTGAVRAAIRSVDPGATVYRVATMQERIGSAMERSRFAGWAMTVFAAVALVLTCVGLYALMAYVVRRRTREIGVRIAIGAGRSDVTRMVLRQGMTLLASGVVLGVAAAVALTRVLTSMLFGVTATDPLTFVTIPLMLAGVGLLACYGPARRAATMDPVRALRYE